MKNPALVAELLAQLKDECEFAFEFDAVAALAATVSELPQVKAVADNHQEFRGKMYYRQSNGHYYGSRGRKTNKSALHRDVWKCYYGEIPDGCEIHHRDNNPANNALENLQCLTKAEHRRIHNAQKTESVCVVCGKTFLTRIHYPSKTCSKQCENAYRYRNKTIVCTCAICGAEFTARENRPRQTCSAECRRELRRRSLARNYSNKDEK